MTLNPSQLKAVHLDAPLIVVPSGPGSGKTRTAVERTARLLRAGRSVLVLTFTNSGASEFRSRILGDLNASKYSDSPWVGKSERQFHEKQSIRSVSECTSARADFLTLHAYCFRLIRRHGHLIGYTSDGVSMLPPGDADELLEEVRDSLGFKMNLKDLQVHESGAVQVQQVWNEYRFRLKQNNLVDYDRILFDGLALLGMPEVRAAVAVDELIVEEAQDSAAIDWSIYNAIPAASRFIIGDVDQAIFEFRAAYPEGFLNLIESKEAAVLPLEENYRCAEQICYRANCLIGYNANRYPKQTISRIGQKGTVTVEGFNEPWGEMVRMGELIALHHGKSIAVLCRTNHGIKQAREFLGTIGMPVHTAYGRGNFNRFNQPADWRLATLLIGLIVSPYNEIIVEQLLRLNHPLATVTQWKLEERARGGSLCDRFDGARAVGTRQQVFNFLAVNGVTSSTVDLIQQRATLLPENASIADLLQDLHGRDLFEQQQPADTIYTGTIHSAKGREFDVVFLPMFEESRMNDENIEEERRLAFVALTRARTYVHISFSRQRRPRWGDTEYTRPSRFIEEMGLELP